MASHLHAQIACDQFWTWLRPPLVTKGCHALPISNPNSTYFLKNTSSNPPRIPKGAKLVWQYVWSFPHNHKNIITTWIGWTLPSMKIRKKKRLYSTNSTTIQRHFDHGISNSPHSLPTNHHKHPPSLELALLLTSNFTTQNCMRIFLENLKQGKN